MVPSNYDLVVKNYPNKWCINEKIKSLQENSSFKVQDLQGEKKGSL